MNHARISAFLSVALFVCFGIVPTHAAWTSAPDMAPAAEACPVVVRFMKLGAPTNATADVTRLQHFLKEHEGLAVDVNGTFDVRTEDAVKAFQKKHADLILAPWGATKASGIVYITTGKAVNNIACGTALVLNGSDMRTIAAYGTYGDRTAEARATSAQGPAVASEDVPAYVDPNDLSGPATNTAPIGPGMADDDAANTAAVGNSTAGRFMTFLEGLFK